MPYNLSAKTQMGNTPLEVGEKEKIRLVWEKTKIGFYVAKILMRANIRIEF
ncbi:hypothetical protein LPTSP1_35020 [Leptospira johnsonii]|uniref:Uncharacterized protein n=1 Tax=Leptospira johnsonii TaxID=1917820 RepID=A0A2P2D772_9LEPT|nr:hypothetical protein LPTSP1_35020 [Leptospira johnsonii]